MQQALQFAAGFQPRGLAIIPPASADPAEPLRMFLGGGPAGASSHTIWVANQFGDMAGLVATGTTIQALALVSPTRLVSVSTTGTVTAFQYNFAARASLDVGASLTQVWTISGATLGLGTVSGGSPLAVDDLGNVYVAGSNAGGTAGVLAKVSPAGALVFSVSNSTSGITKFLSVDWSRLTRQVFVAANNGTSDGYLCCYTGNTLLWQARLRDWRMTALLPAPAWSYSSTSPQVVAVRCGAPSYGVAPVFALQSSAQSQTDLPPKSHWYMEEGSGIGDWAGAAAPFDSVGYRLKVRRRARLLSNSGSNSVGSIVVAGDTLITALGTDLQAWHLESNGAPVWSQSQSSTLNQIYALAVV